MTDSAKPKTPKKKSTKSKGPKDHPPYGVMIRKAIAALKDRKGSSRQAIIKWIRANYKVNPDKADLYVRMALRAGVKSGKLVHAKGVGASGSFRLPEKKKATGEGKKVAKKPKSKSAGKKSTPKKKKTPAKKKAAAPAAESTGDSTAPAPVAKKAKTPKKPKAASKKPKKSPAAKKKPVKRLSGSKKPKAAGKAKKK